MTNEIDDERIPEQSEKVQKRVTINAPDDFNDTQIERSKERNDHTDVYHQQSNDSTRLRRSRTRRQENLDLLDEEQIAHIHRAFELFDVDNTGTISPNELRGALRALGHNVPNSVVREFMTLVDTDGDGNLDVEEFTALIAMRVRAAQERSKMEAIFECLDEQKTGFLLVDNIQNAVNRFGLGYDGKFIEEMLKAADIDEDGSISLQDFLEFTKSIGLW
mmetsp:Transcript_7487/g.13531  ORF Transcript_7487/g.13531 Transcript_7487/m.13531 type:complete len:219 (+) Transcript_7487:75-731(+)